MCNDFINTIVIVEIGALLGILAKECPRGTISHIGDVIGTLLVHVAHGADVGQVLFAVFQIVIAAADLGVNLIRMGRGEETDEEENNSYPKHLLCLIHDSLESDQRK